MESPTPPSKKQKEPLHRHLLFWIILLCILAFIKLSQTENENKKTASNNLPVQVVLAKVATSNVPVYLTAIGNVAPTYSVTVHTQVNGTLLNVFYKEGQLVKQGDLLAQIDPRPFEAQLMQYQGQLQRDKALLVNARIDLKRYQTLWKQNSVAQQTLATQISLVHQYQGAVKTDKGLIQATKVNLIYAHITSPISGRVGLRLVDPGNIVQTTDTNGLLVINTLNPITVIFTLPEDNIPAVAKLVYSQHVLPVDCYDRNQEIKLATGYLLTIDNQVDPTTGTVKLRAQFANQDNRLFPSQFVNVKLLINTLMNATILPTAAIQYSAAGPFVFALKDDLTVTMKPVKIGVTNGENTTISTGIQPNELVITEGADKLIEGSKVNVAQSSQSLLKPEVKSKIDAQQSWWRVLL